MQLFPCVTRNTRHQSRNVPTRRYGPKGHRDRSLDRFPRIGLVFVGIYGANVASLHNPREPIPIDGMYKISSRFYPCYIYTASRVRSQCKRAGVQGSPEPPVVDIYLPRMERKKKEDTRQRGNTKLILMAVSLSTGSTARALHRNINGAIRHPTIITLEINNPLCPGARVNTARFLQQREGSGPRKKDLFKK